MEKITSELFKTTAIGAYADVSASAEVNLAVSKNNHAKSIQGKSTVAGGSIDTTLPITPSIGAEMTISDDKNTKSFYNLSAGVAVGIPENPLETHLYRSKTELLHPVDAAVELIKEYL